MKRILVAASLLAPVMLAACGQQQKAASADAVTVVASNAICRPTPKGRQMTGCYVTLTASGADRLMSVSSPLASRVEIHEGKIEGGMMMMRELTEGLALPAGQAVELKPGGNHIMLLGVEDPLAAGETAPLTLTFASAAPVEITAAVGEPPAETAPAAAAAPAHDAAAH
jgi:copper(I)-binding protein